MTAIKFTHANGNGDMYLLLAKICGYYRSEQHRCTFVVSDGQTIFPAKESVEEVKGLIERASIKPTQGEADVRNA